MIRELDYWYSNLNKHIRASELQQLDAELGISETGQPKDYRLCHAGRGVQG
jgi:hypothetical protein